MKNKGKELGAMLAGLFFAVPTYFVLNYLKIPNALILAAISGLIYNLLIYIIFVVTEAVHDKRCKEAKKQIDCEIFYEFNGNLRLAAKIKNYYVCFCDQGVILISVEKRKPEFFEILRENIYMIENDTVSTIYIKTFDKLLYLIECADICALNDALDKHGWIDEFKSHFNNGPDGDAVKSDEENKSDDDKKQE